jgi:hypothetical protein
MSWLILRMPLRTAMPASAMKPTVDATERLKPTIYIATKLPISASGMLAKMTLAARAMMMPSACTALYSLI